MGVARPGGAAAVHPGQRRDDQARAAHVGRRGDVALGLTVQGEAGARDQNPSGTIQGPRISSLGCRRVIDTTSGVRVGSGTSIVS